MIATTLLAAATLFNVHCTRGQGIFGKNCVFNCDMKTPPSARTTSDALRNAQRWRMAARPTR